MSKSIPISTYNKLHITNTTTTSAASSKTTTTAAARGRRRPRAQPRYSQLLLSRKESSFPSLNFLFSGPSFRKQHHYTASTAYGLCRDFQQHTRPHSGYWLLISTWNSIWNSWYLLMSLTCCLMMRFGLIHQAWPHIH